MSLLDAAAIDAAFTPLPLREAAYVDIEDEAVVLEPSGRAHLLTPTGSLVWSLLDGQASVAELAAEIAEALAVDRRTVESDVLAFVQTLGRQGLLEGVAASAPPPPVREEGLPEGTPLPGFDALGVPGPALVVSWSPRCGYCVRLAPVLAGLRDDLAAAGVSIVLVAIGEQAENDDLLASSGLDATLVRGSGLEAGVFAGLGTPVGYLLDAGGRTTAGLAIGSTEVEQLARSVAGAA